MKKFLVDYTLPIHFSKEVEANWSSEALEIFKNTFKVETSPGIKVDDINIVSVTPIDEKWILTGSNHENKYPPYCQIFFGTRNEACEALMQVVWNVWKRMEKFEGCKTIDTKEYWTNYLKTHDYISGCGWTFNLREMKTNDSNKNIALFKCVDDILK